MQAIYRELAQSLEAAEDQIIGELLAVQGHPG
jgi:monomeric isocitrate dehydrogenase